LRFRAATIGGPVTGSFDYLEGFLMRKLYELRQDRFPECSKRLGYKLRSRRRAMKLSKRLRLRFNMDVFMAPMMVRGRFKT
jgi:hypothetical protein